jgi:hypothetical protein
VEKPGRVVTLIPIEEWKLLDDYVSNPIVKIYVQFHLIHSNSLSSTIIKKKMLLGELPTKSTRKISRE